MKRASNKNNLDVDMVLDPDSETNPIQLPRQKTYRRRQPVLKPDQPLPTLPDEDTAVDLQSAFQAFSQNNYDLLADSEFDFSQSSRVVGNSIREEPDIFNRLDGAAQQPLKASAGKAPPHDQQPAQKLVGLIGDESDGCDFDE